MVDDDLPEFTTLLDSVCALLTRGSYAPNDTSTMIFFRALAEYPMQSVRWAFTEHARRSRFSPTPADLLDLLREKDGRPGPEEAWAIAQGAASEADTVVWTQEISAAWNVAREVMALGDEVGARMAFRESYTRAVDASRRDRRPMRWIVSEGFDVARRVDAVRAAIDAGKRIEGADELLALQVPRAALLPKAVGDSQMPESLRLLRDRFAAPRPYRPGPDVEGREKTASLRDAACAQAAAYAKANGIDMGSGGKEAAA